MTVIGSILMFLFGMGTGIVLTISLILLWTWNGLKNVKNNRRV